MGRRPDADWTAAETLTDEYLMEIFGQSVRHLTGLKINAHSDGRNVVFHDAEGNLRHFVYRIDDNNWACWCRNAIDEECPASTYARIRFC